MRALETTKKAFAQTNDEKNERKRAGGARRALFLPCQTTNLLSQGELLRTLGTLVTHFLLHASPCDHREGICTNKRREKRERKSRGARRALFLPCQTTNLLSQGELLRNLGTLATHFLLHASARDHKEGICENKRREKREKNSREGEQSTFLALPNHQSAKSGRAPAKPRHARDPLPSACERSRPQ